MVDFLVDHPYLSIDIEIVANASTKYVNLKSWILIIDGLKMDEVVGADSSVSV